MRAPFAISVLLPVIITSPFVSAASTDGSIPSSLSPMSMAISMDETGSDQHLHRRGQCASTPVGEYMETADDRFNDCPGKGLWVDSSTCTAFDAKIVRADVWHMAVLASAGLRALTPLVLSKRGNPYSHFFGRSDPNGKVYDVLRRVQQYGLGETPDQASPIRISCTDEGQRCSVRGLDGRRPTAYSRGDNTIVLCDSFYMKPAIPNTPCRGGLTTDGVNGVGAQSQAQTLIHVLTHAMDEEIGDYAFGAFMCNELVRRNEPGYRPLVVRPDYMPGKDPTRNANSYAHFAALAHDLGVGGPLNHFRRSCLRLWNPPFPSPESAYVGENTIGPW